MRTMSSGVGVLLVLLSVACSDDGETGVGGSGGAGGDAGNGGGGGGGDGGGGGEPSCVGTESDDPKFAQALQVLRDALGASNIPGGAIAVIEKGKPVQFGVAGSKRAGVCDPITPDTLFNLSYASVVLTGIAALDAVEDGKLSLEDPISDIVGPLPVDVGGGYANDITLHHLLTNSSMYTSSADAQPQHSTCMGLAEVFETAVDRTIEAPPGSMHDADDRWNAELTALALETVDNQTFPDVIATRVLGPLGMGGTFDLDEVLASDHTLGHTPAGESEAFDCPNHYASYGYFGNIQDMAKLGEYLTADGPPVLEPVLFEAMLSPQGINFYSGYSQSYITDLREEPGGEHMHLNGGGAFAFNHILLVLPERGLAVIAVLNFWGLGTEEIAFELANIYGFDTDVSGWLDPDYEPLDADLASLVGFYEDPIGFGGSGPRMLEISQPDADSIVGTLSSAEVDAQTVLFGTPYSRDTFQTVGGSDVRFWRDDSDQPYAVQFRQYHGPPFFRVDP